MTTPDPPQPTREQAIALLRRGLDKALQMVAAQYVMPIATERAAVAGPQFGRKQRFEKMHVVIAPECREPNPEREATLSAVLADCQGRFDRRVDPPV